MADCATATFWVSHPSGGQLITRGRLTFITGGHHCPVVVPDDESAPVVVLDPRVVVRCGGRVIYAPREHLRCLPRWARQWLQEHPDWGRAA